MTTPLAASTDDALDVSLFRPQPRSAPSILDHECEFGVVDENGWLIDDADDQDGPSAAEQRTLRDLQSVVGVLAGTDRSASELDAVEAACSIAAKPSTHPLFLERVAVAGAGPRRVHCLEALVEYVCRGCAPAGEPELDCSQPEKRRRVAATPVAVQYAVLALARLSSTAECCRRMVEPAAGAAVGPLLRVLLSLAVNEGSYATAMLRQKSADVIVKLATLSPRELDRPMSAPYGTSAVAASMPGVGIRSAWDEVCAWLDYATPVLVAEETKRQAYAARSVDLEARQQQAGVGVYSAALASASASALQAQTQGRALADPLTSAREQASCSSSAASPQPDRSSAGGERSGR
jgi:hypothetical protein